MSFALYGKLRRHQSRTGENLDADRGTLDSRLRGNDNLHIRSAKLTNQARRKKRSLFSPDFDDIPGNVFFRICECIQGNLVNFADCKEATGS